MRTFSCLVAATAVVVLAVPSLAAVPKRHSVVLGVAKKVPYSRAGDPAGAIAGETELKIRALVVDAHVKEWTTGEAHDVTDRSFVVRRAVRLNNSLPGDKQEQWVWQRGPWLLVERTTGRVTPLKLPDYDPAVSEVVWFRDYGAYCGVTPSGKSLYAVVAQLAVRKPVLAHKLEAYNAQNPTVPACAAPEWQREPLRVTYYPSGTDAVSFRISAGSAELVEDSGDEADTGGGEAPAK